VHQLLAADRIARLAADARRPQHPSRRPIRRRLGIVLISAGARLACDAPLQVRHSIH
jgi:hypothetical protein